MSQRLLDTVRKAIDDVNHHETTILSMRDTYTAQLKSHQRKMMECEDDDAGSAAYDGHEKDAFETISNLKAINSVLNMITEVRRTVDYIDVYQIANTPAAKIVSVKSRD